MIHTLQKMQPCNPTSFHKFISYQKFPKRGSCQKISTKSTVFRTSGL